MKKCLRITFSADLPKDFLRSVIQKHAQKIGIEGTAQLRGDGQVKVIASAEKDILEDFIDILHKELLKIDAENVEIEPFIKDRDYRGVFRVIE